MYRRFLQLWFVLLLLLGFGTTAASTPTACTGAHCVYLPIVSKPELVSISNVRFVRLNYQDIGIAGEVSAITSTPVYSITLEFRMYDHDGEVYIISRGSPVFSATLPGESNPFIFETDLDPRQEINAYDIRVSDYRLTSPRTYLPLVVNVSSTRCEDHNHYKIEGTITNQHDQPLEDVTGIVWDRLILEGLSPLKIAERLDPFEIVPFSTSIYVEDCGEFARTGAYQIAAQGMVPQ